MSSEAEPEQADAFWHYAVAVYGREGVSERCLYLQDSHGVDVNILLFVAWLGAAKGRTVSAEDCRVLIDATAQWRREVVRAIRAVRRRVKPMAEADPRLDVVYRSLKRTELDAERAEHAMLIAAADALGQADTAADAGANMHAYLEAEGVEPAGEAADAAAAISRLASP